MLRLRAYAREGLLSRDFTLISRTVMVGRIEEQQIMQTSQVGTMTDITNLEQEVEVQIRADGKVLWVNIDGVCVLRVCQIPVPIHITRQKAEVGEDGALAYADRVVLA